MLKGLGENTRCVRENKVDGSVKGKQQRWETKNNSVNREEGLGL